MAGGAGIVVCEEASVHPSDWPYERCPLASQCGPGWARLAATAGVHGTLALAAIGHTGGQGSSAYSQAPLLAPSGVPEVNTREVPKVMEQADIDAVVAGFGAAAAQARRAGLAGVEVNAGQNSLIRQFLSGLTNQRGDDYGSDRLRFAREVMTAVRASAGDDAVVGLRLSCDELAPWAGIVPEAAAEIAAALVELADYLVVVRGAIFSVSATRPDGHDAPGFNLDLVAQIRVAVDGAVPVAAQGSIVDVGQAEWAIEDGRSDLVEMTRAQIADPELVIKAREHPEQIRPCILCNQTCKVRDGRNPIITCVGEPRSGHEVTDEAVVPGSVSGHDVVVVGGGPAGLECARVAATLGHRVVLMERSDRCGGVLRTAANGAGRERLATLADWLEHECRRLGVRIETGTEIEIEQVSTLSADAEVILCTGGRPGRRDYLDEGGDDDGGDDERGTVRTAEDVLGGVPLPEGPVAVWDPIGGPIGVSVAELLLAQGRQVLFVTQDHIAGNLLSLSGDLAPANVRLQAAGAVLVRRSILRAVRSHEIEIEHRFTGERTTLEAVALIDAGHRLPDETLRGVDLPRAGDGVAPRTVHEAVLEGRRVAQEIGGRSSRLRAPIAGGT